MDEKKVLLSGIQPSGDLTLGSYLGAIKNWAELAEQFDCYYFMADMHTITVRQNPADLRRHTLEQLAQYIACGLDPEKNTLFIQSHVHQHAELGWVLQCYTMFGELSRMTQFKDKSAKNAENINGGLFAYPSLMAADILLYRPDYVPVGEDQKQHVELTRDIANRFNGIYGDVFKVPEPYIPKVGARVMGLQNPTSKMSKSDKDPNGCVYLKDDNDTVMRKFKRAVTDSETCVRYDRQEKPGISNLMEIYSACTGKTYAEIETEFQGNQLLHKHLEPTGDMLESGNRKDADQCGGNQQNRCDNHAGDQSRIHVFQAKQAYTPGFVQYSVPHGLLNCLLRGWRWNQQAGNHENRHNNDPADQELFVLHRLLLSCSLSAESDTLYIVDSTLWLHF